MPASIHNTSEASKLFKEAPIPSPSLSSSTVSCDSIKTIEAWLENVERPEVTVIVKDLSKAGPDLAQEPEAKNTRKRKHSSSFSEETLSQSSIPKRLQHLPQLITADGMADNTMEAGQLPVTPKSSSVGIPSTPSTSKTRSKAGVDSSWAAGSLEMHGLKCDYQALGRYPNFRQRILEIISSERHSEMKLKSVERIEKISPVLEEENEATYMNNLLPLIIKKERIAGRKNDGSTSHSGEMSGDEDIVEVLNPEPGVVYRSRDWFDDGVYAVTDHDFRKDLLPHGYIDEQVAQMLKKDDNMLTPRPDRCYGLLRNWIPVPNGIQLSSEIRKYIEPCPNLSHPFFLIEGKSNKGDKFGMLLQARRGGASLVNAMRQLLTKIGEPLVTGSGVDDRNFVFSATMFPGLIDIWVHWAELENGQAIFHMNPIKSFATKDSDQIRQARKILNNIMTWGLDLKARRLNELHEKIYTWQRKETAKLVEELAEETRKKEAERQEKEKKKEMEKEKKQEKSESRKRLRSG
ncbi:hypothetical protein JMJ35_010708 [Cladonia borealis]|uniref:DUF7924 domain-containing protein n=1 Tax=Cladonia borealis TaxID=184061 RepID=A0AA39QS36_9LECA|nr:hypothetical protein JMJ35_010708 [Cladonia borealis]